MKKRKRNVAYSTDRNWMPANHQSRQPKRSLPPSEQTAELHLEKKGRGGKTVSIVRGLQLSTKDTKALSKKLKQACGSGGSIKNDDIEIQGDHREKMATLLQELGYKTKMVGG